MSECEVFEDSLICRVGTDCERFLTFGSEMAGRGGHLAAGCVADVHVPCKVSKPAEFCISGRSPFPAVDIFIQSIACIEGTPGKIRSWYWFSEYGVLVYNIIGNRYCENIGRQHKSNHVMYIVDFRTAGYYQKCHDPECRGYRSPLRPVPCHMIPSNFPLSLSLESCYANTETSMAYFGHDECSAGILSRLSITKDSENLDHDCCKNGLAWRESDQVEEDENAWWEEVLNSMEDSEQKQTRSINEQGYLAENFSMDDEWWESVQQELEMHVFEEYGKRV